MFLGVLAIVSLLLATPVEPVQYDWGGSNPATVMTRHASRVNFLLVMVWTLVSVTASVSSVSSLDLSSGSDISSDEDTGGPNMEPQPGSEVEWGLVKTGKSVQGKND